MEAVNQYARPVDAKRDKSVPGRCYGYGWVRFANGEFVFAPAVYRVTSRGTARTVSALFFMGSNESVCVPGSPEHVIDAIVDALGVGTPSPFTYGRERCISQLG